MCGRERGWSEVRDTWRVAAGSAAAGLAVALTAVAVAGPWDFGQRTAERARAASWDRGSGADHTGAGLPGGPAPAPSAAEVLTALGAAPAGKTRKERGGRGDEAAGKAAPEPGEAAPEPGEAPAPAPAALADTLQPLLEDTVLGTLRTASVVDVATGRELYGARAGRGVAPASTVKIATAVAALSALGPDHRIPTRVVWDPDGERVFLVGGGDPTVTPAALRRLADTTARELRERGVKRVEPAHDISLYSGPVRHPIGPNENIAPVVALMVNEGRLDDSTSGPAPRSGDPARDAAGIFTDRLRERGVDVERPEHPGRARRAPRGAEELAVHRSAPLAELVERMMLHSDNDIGEALFRQTAVARGEPASFAGAGRAVRAQLAQLTGDGRTLPLKGARFADGSGLDRSGRVSAGLLTRLLALAADPARPELRSVLTGLPVARFSGTLGGRYDDEATRTGAGLVRAKTGTLTGINTLAGTVVDADGRLLAFAFTASGTTDRYGAHDALDRLAAALANCGCR
ncbi:D-alanyl-D-alanine carboxypeptidase/D-alanyl-D-alanine endopeptidase [Streptomyces pini]|uniref:D-alanyl-D-alanine carboxypeptidase / D-alanyl-D-alanine-endopeptidase (Penicillin-binding protein 4) n=1 Tax=Streptomyces pini TaxID=1520580 RepID=A0A1I4KC18_9ACTN|nr:D-alanyl-D-alanine carboxypeptidase/D-alanyl-D-alanine-endopeptidase [Streptomyces pini]SFL76133.1 D-alanyl-D-alanine carboxypeptidase / D-alanyl-D-alanine-endopeptidase (penicillin-binding protein 4) [Streptomyces pini]